MMKTFVETTRVRYEVWDGKRCVFLKVVPFGRERIARPGGYNFRMAGAQQEGFALGYQAEKAKREA